MCYYMQNESFVNVSVGNADKINKDIRNEE